MVGRRRHQGVFRSCQSRGTAENSKQADHRQAISPPDRTTFTSWLCGGLEVPSHILRGPTGWKSQPAPGKRLLERTGPSNCSKSNDVQQRWSQAKKQRIPQYQRHGSGSQEEGKTNRRLDEVQSTPQEHAEHPIGRSPRPGIQTALLHKIRRRFSGWGYRNRSRSDRTEDMAGTVLER